MSTNVFERYVAWNTVVHRLDPRTKLTFMVVLFISALLYASPVYNLLVFAVVLVAGALGGIVQRHWRTLIGILVPVAALTMVLWPFFVKGGTPVLDVSPWGSWRIVLTREALAFALAMGLRIVTMITTVYIFLATTSFSDMALGLYRMGIPYRLSFFVSATLRQMESLMEGVRQIQEARQARGESIGDGSLLERMRKIARLLVPFMTISLPRIEQLTISLETRAWGTARERHPYRTLRLTTADLVGVALAVCLLVAVLYTRFVLKAGLIPGITL